MKKLILLFILSSAIISCTEEQVQQIQENQLVTIMTTGQWVVKKMMVNTTDKTADFSNYKFQFKKDNSVDAIIVSTGAVEKSGTWSGSMVPPNITSNFVGANATLSLLNATWTIKDTGLGTPAYVEASTTVGSEVRTMRLERL